MSSSVCKPVARTAEPDRRSTHPYWRGCSVLEAFELLTYVLCCESRLTINAHALAAEHGDWSKFPNRHPVSPISVLNGDFSRNEAMRLQELLLPPNVRSPEVLETDVGVLTEYGYFGMSDPNLRLELTTWLVAVLYGEACRLLSANGISLFYNWKLLSRAPNRCQ